MSSAPNQYLYYLLAIVLSAVVSGYALKKIIFVTRNKKIYDTPDDTRKFHGAEIPTLGGFGIFLGYMMVATLFWPKVHFYMPYVLCSSMVLVAVGIYDDLMNMNPPKKLMAQLAASFITIYFADIHISGSALGIVDLPYWVSIIITTVLCTFYINVFNFIDGIDGLACTLAILYTAVLGVLLSAIGHVAAAGIVFSLMGATIGLLWYNRAPAKIYMGDTGSMLLGFTIFCFSVMFVNFNGGHNIADFSLIRSSQGAVSVIASMLFLPVYDALRVFVLRMAKGISPLRADRRHLHYYLLDAGLSHTQAVIVILVLNIAFVILGFAMQGVNIYVTLLVLTVISSIAAVAVHKMRDRAKMPKHGAIS
jgi:UDP-GlcNAc:undecaprenyl-phosphate GlcNAc-1-phosphate transferase